MGLAHDFALALSQGGITITSGLALGIDGAAHRGALSGSGHTIAVLGSGIDCVYPKSHQGLANDILSAGGLILSEFPLGTAPLPWHFPKRNRIISGLSQGVLVVEATLGSGSLKTAEHALQQGREVFAVPGSVHSPLSRGCHSLIQQGAKLVNDLSDILTELPSLSRVTPSKVNQETLEISPLLRYIGYECASLDVLLQGTGLDIGRLSADLLELELQGYIASVPGGYIRVASR
jgi:DNA processing protein